MVTIQELWRILIIVLIAGIFSADGNCKVSKYSKECLCTNYNPYFVMDCPPTNNFNSINFKIKYIPGDYVMITCGNNPNWSTFHYEINSITDEVKKFSLLNCTFEDDVNITKIAKLVGAEKTQSLRFAENFKYKNLTLRKDHLRGFPNVFKLSINDNAFLGDLQEDLLQPLPQLTQLFLRNNNIKSIPKDFFQFVPNLTQLELGDNKIQKFAPETFKNLKHLKSLNLWKNELVELNNIFADLVSLITFDLHNNNLTTLPQGIFEKLSQLEKVDLKGNKFETLPGDLFQKNKKLTSVKIRMVRTLKNLPGGLFSNLTNLTVVELDRCKLESLPEDLFQGSKELKKIVLNANALRTLPAKIFDGLVKLDTLYLNDNEIETLPDKLFSSCENLKILNLFRNRIMSISSSLFIGLVSLDKLIMHDNNVTNIDRDAFSTLKNVTEINLSHNNITDLKIATAAYGEISVFQLCRGLQSLDLSYNKIPLIFSDWIVTPPLSFKYLDLSHNALTKLTTDDLDFKHSKDFKINLTGNNITEIDLTEDFEQRFLQEDRQNIELNIQNNPVACDCSLFNFVRYLDGTMNETIRNKLLIQIGTMKCSSPKVLEDTLLSNLKSRDYKCIPSRIEKYDNHTLCPKSCTQWKRPYDKTLIFDCSNKNLTQAPETLCSLTNNEYFNELDLTGNFLKNIPSLHQTGYQRVKTLLLSQNHISNVPKEAFSPTLRTLELDNNEISTLSAETLSRINTSLQSVTLGGNPWKCNCEAREFQNMLQIRGFPIQDMQQVTCKNSKKVLRTLTVNELCPGETEMIVGISLVIAFLGLMIGALAGLYYRYQMEIKVWLYAHQMCLWFVTEEELDKEKPYDAFVSYSHKDELFVRELIMRLENGPRPFKLCIHYRDWLAGEWIPTQIAKSVEDSKRTIVVVSPNFVQSEWGRLEFRAAHSQALNEGRARVIVILYGDIGSTDKLDPELKTYLSMNTYVEWGDPWFWDKLVYALPHKSDLASRTPGSRIFKRHHPSAQLNFNKNEIKQVPESGMTPLNENLNKNLQNGSVIVEMSDDESKKLNSIC